MSQKYQYPCTGHISMDGFGKYLEEETTGSRVNLNTFADELEGRFNVPYITLVNSGSSANLTAALVLAEKLRKAGRPLTAAASAFTFPTTISSLILSGFSVDLVDTDGGEFNFSLSELKKTGKSYSLIVLTHFLGFPCRMDEIREYADEHHMLILQDACETLGMIYKGKPVFAYGDITTWSFYHPHHLSAYGGGAVITLNQDDFIIADSVSHWGRSCKCHIDPALCQVPEGPAHQFTYERLGLNVEMSELNACFGRWQLQRWEEYESARFRNYGILYETLKDNSEYKIWPLPDTGNSPFVFPVQLRNGKTIMDAWRKLSAEGIEIRTLMGGVANEQKAFQNYIDDTVLPHAHTVGDTTFFVGIHQTLPEESVRHVAEAINSGI